MAILPVRHKCKRCGEEYWDNNSYPSLCFRCRKLGKEQKMLLEF